MRAVELVLVTIALGGLLLVAVGAILSMVGL